MSYFIYVIGPAEPPIKIGITGDCEQRLRSLQTGHSQKLYIHHREPVDKKLAKLYEGIIHKNLKWKQTHGEWFDIPIQDAIAEIRWCFIRYENEENLHYKKRTGTLLG